MRRGRKGKHRPRETGYIVTWDVDSTNRALCAKLQRFIFRDVTKSEGRTYRYPGFVEKEGVRYLGQSVLFLRPTLLEELTFFLARHGVDQEVTAAALG